MIPVIHMGCPGVEQTEIPDTLGIAWLSEAIPVILHRCDKPPLA
jgi:hypothetical protein